MGGFFFEVLFWISFHLALRLLWFYFWPHLELRASWQFEFPCRPPRGLYSRVTTKVPAAPRRGAARTYCLLSVTALSAAWSHHLLSSVFPFYVYIFTHATIHTWREGRNWGGTGSPGFNGSTPTHRFFCHILKLDMIKKKPESLSYRLLSYFHDFKIVIILHFIIFSDV